MGSSLANTKVLFAALLLGSGISNVSAVPGPPLTCNGQFGTSGCAPYRTVSHNVGLSSPVVYEYDNVDLAYVYDQDPSAFLRGSVSLDDGKLTAFGETGSSGRTQTIATGADVFTFTQANGQGGFATVTAILNMVGKAFLGFNGASASADVFFNTQSLVAQAGSTGGGASFQAGVNAPVALSFDYGGAAYHFVNVPLNTPLRFDYSLRHVVRDGVMLDSDAWLDFDLPPGVSVTSMGGFVQTTPVPEPATWVMLGLGLLLVTGAARRR